MKLAYQIFGFLLVIVQMVTSAEVATSDEAILKKINDLFEKLPANNKGATTTAGLPATIITTTDKKCMVEKYKQNKIDAAIPTQDLVTVFSSGKMNQIAAGVAFIDIAVLCNSKTDIILKFIFENFMSFHILFVGFSDAPELKEIVEQMKCANKYAIEHKILDQNVYKIDNKVSPGQEENCKKLLTTFARGLGPDFAPKNVIEILIEIESFLLKYGLMIQVELTAANKEQERTKFIAEARALLEKLLKVAAETALTVAENK